MIPLDPVTNGHPAASLVTSFQTDAQNKDKYRIYYGKVWCMRPYS